MFKSFYKGLFCLMVILGLCVPSMGAETPEEKGLSLVTAIDRSNSGFGSDDATLELTMLNANGDEIIRKLKVQSQEFPKDGDRSIVTFTWPADVKSTRMLTWSHIDGDDDQWLYLPALKRIKRIATNNKSSSFMGSEFSYEDMSTPELPEYTYKYLEDVSWDNRDCWKIERVSRSARSGYSKEIVFYDQKIMNPVRIEYYDRRGELLKVATLTGYKQYDRWWRPGAISMENVKTAKTSVMRWTSYHLTKKYSTDYFTPANLED